MSMLCSTSVRCGEPLEEALAAISRAGFRSIDLLTIDGWVHVNPSDLARDWDGTFARTKELLRKYGLTPVATNSGVGPQLHDRSAEGIARRAAETAALVRFMNEFGIGIAAVQPRNADRDRPWPDVLRDCVASLREQKAIADAGGVKLALELHVNSPFETMAQADALCEAMPELPLVYDPSHFAMQGVDLRETVRLMDRAAHVHLRDAAPGKLQTRFGEGGIDFGWLMAELRRRGFRGHVSIEYLQSGDMDVLEDAVRLRDAIARLDPEGDI